MLNCENYFWSEYSGGADVLLQDTYMIGNNVTFSNQWGTPCTVDYGDCGYVFICIAFDSGVLIDYS